MKKTLFFSLLLIACTTMACNLFTAPGQNPNNGADLLLTTATAYIPESQFTSSALSNKVYSDMGRKTGSANNGRGDGICDYKNSVGGTPIFEITLRPVAFSGEGIVGLYYSGGLGFIQPDGTRATAGVLDYSVAYDLVLGGYQNLPIRMVVIDGVNTKCRALHSEMWTKPAAYGAAPNQDGSFYMPGGNPLAGPRFFMVFSR